MASHPKMDLINIIFNKDGIGNFDIALKDQSKEPETKSKPLSLKLKEYALENFKFHFYDEKSKMRFNLDSINHEGQGDFASSVLDLNTKTYHKSYGRTGRS